MPDRASEVTAAEIARLAGVGRAAVSNWRRRHADFPKPVGGTETSPSFALPEVEQWLRDQGKLAEIPLRERVWQHLADHLAGPVPALVQAGCTLLLVRDRHPAWLELTAVSDERLAELLPAALEQVLTARFGEDAVGLFMEVFTAQTGPATRTEPLTEAVGSSSGPEAPLPASVPFLRGVAELAAELGARQAFEFLLGRYLDANPRQYTLTPPGPAALMAGLAGAGARDVLDPAAGTGTLLRAVERPNALYAQDADPDLAALTGLRLALHSDATVRARAGDTLRGDAFPKPAFDAVLCHPPFNERNWGHDELAYDPRWEYGFPARTESELAWVQHTLARLRPGGAAVLLMPPAAASRRSGRRIRAGLLRRGALRAVIALPAGAAPPYGIPLHIWVLRKPDPGRAAPPELLFVDTAELAGAGGGRDKLDWQAVHSAVLDAWQPFDKHGTAEEQPGVSRSVPVIELLDDDVDLAPARHLPPPAAAGGADELLRVRDRLADTLRLTRELTPAPAAHAEPVPWPATTVGELARAGALVISAGGTGSTSTEAVPVLTEQDVLSGTAPSGTLPEGPDEEPVRLEEGDVVVPVLGGGSVVRVIDEATAGAALGRNLQLLHPDPAALDPWFLAGFLRGTANTRQASSYASTATRLDVRRLQLPRLPLADQQRYGERFRALAEFEDALKQAGRLGEQLVQGLYDGLTDGTVTRE
ncbi:MULTISPECIES: N-6 DNA methylase [unclassified Streptomyces]|uniref:N-6 DNA methylase n=1 Tax=unclassified Streptomyces TaxID=2593676 RepID=UPI002DD9E318|nr:N-6 DNA methylase [Streptomyces sp. NBC_01750]WSB02367.1 N-6 DNA methylase [Streptomyces sp. NBC_01794]WSD33364.1 N-6 DNA methylase [Streptomyces sp. NBC_01750]